MEKCNKWVTHYTGHGPCTYSSWKVVQARVLTCQTSPSSPYHVFCSPYRVRRHDFRLQYPHSCKILKYLVYHPRNGDSILWPWPSSELRCLWNQNQQVSITLLIWKLHGLTHCRFRRTRRQILGLQQRSVNMSDFTQICNWSHSINCPAFCRCFHDLVDH